MEKYTVSALKYRPSSFKAVVGQKNLTSTLQNAIRTQQLAHAYLFCGPRGTGKTTCARIFAKSINCLNPTADHEACNQCESCVSFNEQRSFNIHELDAASNNSVEDIRNLIDQVRIPPQIGKYSVYIIDEVHMLSKDAFNALLKTLEEPPSYAIFILATTEKHKVIPTILSRCQIYDFSRMTISDTIAHLQNVAKQEGITVSDEALQVVAQKADGGMRDALSTFDQLVAFCGKTITYDQAISVLNVLDTEYYFHLMDYSLHNDIASSLLTLNEILNKGFEAVHFISGLASHVRDLLVSKDARTTELLETSDSIRIRYQEQAKLFSAAYLFAALKITTEAEINYRQARNKRLTVELMLIKLCQISAPQADLSAPAPMQPAPKQPQQPQQPVAPQQSSPTAAPIPAPTTPAPAAKAAFVQPSMPTIPTIPSKPTAMASSIPSIPVVPSMPKVAPAAGPAKASDQASAHRTNSFTEYALTEAWRTLGQQFPNNDRLIAILTAAQVSTDGQNIFIQVASALQEEVINEHKGTIHQHLHDVLQNDDVNIMVQVNALQNERPLSKEEQFAQLKTQNSALEALNNALGLTLE